MLIGKGRAFVKDATVDAPTEVLDEATENPSVDDADCSVEIDAYPRCHAGSRLVVTDGRRSQ